MYIIVIIVNPSVKFYQNPSEEEFSRKDFRSPLPKLHIHTFPLEPQNQTILWYEQLHVKFFICWRFN